MTETDPAGQRPPTPTAAPPPALSSPAARADTRLAHRRAVRHLLSLQREDGCWEGEMVWNTMILSQYVIVRALVSSPVPPKDHAGVVRHFEATCTPQGGWGAHPDAGPSVFCTTLAYCALRLLGLDAAHPLCERARFWLHAQPGGVRAIPTWGKLWLAQLGLYDYAAVNPLPPEVFLLPRALPFHPDRFYCHTRTIYQAMAYLYGARAVTRPAIAPDLRRELFAGDLPVPADRALLGEDARFPPHPLLRAAFNALSWYERSPVRALRARALRRCLRRVVHEQAVTGQAGISPVSSLLNVLVLHASGAAPERVDRALAGLESWRWQDEAEGIRYAGARSQSWDTAFAVEALTAGPRDRTPATDVPAALRAACRFLAGAQLTGNEPDAVVTARAPSDGGWCFSDGAHRWPVSDCTAEAVGALLHASDAQPGAPSLLSADRIARARAFLTHRQNRDGGFGTYEPRRAPRLLGRLNPAEMFTNCMVEDSYTECTASVLVALAAMRGHGAAADPSRTERAVRFLLRSQYADGSWPAAWGVHRIYGTYFAVRGLRAAGLPPGHPALRRAATWLESVQRADGGWGEHHSGCLRESYVEDAVSHPVQTAWALLALLDVRTPHCEAVERGRAWLCAHQQPGGGWRQQAPTGVFFGSAMLDYRLYAAYFPLWALGRWLTAAHDPGDSE
ncbi:putative squalene--hopene cyclase [Streptomyces sp. NBRC 110611]|uniref:prenyltransferase/squalene oxidase repeat-containing protein n=1 Tax=Streptomyces sp. NBRC 110611 TaxID=1621259 RepID=UPI00082DB04E|nr:prenyltransferase/squalene oxidase repeat-containing protein [Streptomyces sp. NBRC 110611]GAU69133.1 putative squalene--hopene cyclase [Streptomyces sp. NBRC 110611]